MRVASDLSGEGGGWVGLWLSVMESRSPSPQGFPENGRDKASPTCPPNPPQEPRARPLPPGHSGEGGGDYRNVKPASSLAGPKRCGTTQMALRDTLG